MNSEAVEKAFVAMIPDSVMHTVLIAAPWVAAVLLGALLLFGYFLPSLIAGVQGKRSIGAIAALNVLLGWTLIGWVAAFIWALIPEPRTNPAPTPHA